MNALSFVKGIIQCLLGGQILYIVHFLFTIIVCLLKTQHFLLSTVESCSMDTLRNCLKSLTDMDMVAYSNGNFQVNNFEKLIELADYLVAFKY